MSKLYRVSYGINGSHVNTIYIDKLPQLDTQFIFIDKAYRLKKDSHNSEVYTAQEVDLEIYIGASSIYMIREVPLSFKDSWVFKD